MSRRTLLVVLALMVAPAAAAADYALAIHGGAGTIARESMTPEREREYHRSLREALATGEAILKAGGTSLDAVTATIQVLEDNPLFNAGRGAVFTAEGRNELDAAIMDGATLNAGAVALDTHGNLAAATSTGGMTNNRWGRVGDVPVIGAGTYADNATAAISATGHGEYFIRSVVAHEISARMRHAGESLEEAAVGVVMGLLVERGGDGGVIAGDRDGNIAMPFNSTGMYRGYVKAGRAPYTAIFREDG